MNARAPGSAHRPRICRAELRFRMHEAVEFRLESKWHKILEVYKQIKNNKFGACLNTLNVDYGGLSLRRLRCKRN